MKSYHISLSLLFPLFTMALQAQTTTKKSGIDISSMEKSVKPGDDFHRFVNGKWLDATEIPADRTRWGSFDELREKTDDETMAIFQSALANPKYTSATDQGKAINYYKTIMDTVSRNNAGTKPLKPLLDQVNAVKSIADLQKLIIEMEPYGGIGFFSAGVGSDAKNSNLNRVHVGPGTVGLPDRDYYISSETDSKEKREKYVAHVAKMLQFLGQKPAEATADANKILALEIAMSQPRLDRVERRDRRNTHNPMTVADLQKLAPAISWETYFSSLGYGKIDTLNVSQPRYMKALNDIFTEKKVADWKAYMRWTLLNRYAGTLSTEIESANWEFFGKTMSGAIKQRARDERALASLNGAIGEAIGKLYVEQKFPPEAKARAEEMIQYLFRAYEKRINDLPWMDEKTRAMAIAKLKKYRVKIGYPDKWRDYSALVLKNPAEGGTYFSNVRALSNWRFKESLKDLKKPVDKERWSSAPQTVNAFYSSTSNEIIFPAGILQPPFYDYKADDAVNFGGIGAVIGHEISHGFDDSGSRYNAEGNLVNWWSEDDLKKFTELGSALAAQYNALEPLPGIFVDGKFTLGENIGDLGGINAAYDGLQIFLNEKGRPGLIDGFTPEQRFFISWGTVWRTKIRDEAIKNLVKTDTHTPGMYRAYVPLQQVDAFYEAFDIKPGDKIYLAPEKRVKIW